MNTISVESLEGLVFQKVEYDRDSEKITFTLEDERVFIMAHLQNCCEEVYVESIVGDLSDLEGEPLLLAEEVTSSDLPPARGSDDSYTWTFYKFATRKGYVDIRWYGSSNGYYSEEVSLYGDV